MTSKSRPLSEGPKDDAEKALMEAYKAALSEDSGEEIRTVIVADGDRRWLNGNRSSEELDRRNRQVHEKLRKLGLLREKDLPGEEL